MSTVSRTRATFDFSYHREQNPSSVPLPLHFPNVHVTTFLFSIPFYLFLSVLGVSISVEADVGDNEPDAAPLAESPVAPTPPPNSVASDAVKSDSAEVETANSTPETMREESVTVQVNEPSPVADEGHSPVRSPYTIAGFTGTDLCVVTRLSWLLCVPVLMLNYL